MISYPRSRPKRTWFLYSGKFCITGLKPINKHYLYNAPLFNNTISLTPEHGKAQYSDDKDFFHTDYHFYWDIRIKEPLLFQKALSNRI